MMGAALPVADLVAVSIESPTGHDALIVHKRDRIVVSISLGATRIERAATALQNARSGQMLFVRTSDGDVLSVRAAKAP